MNTPTPLVFTVRVDFADGDHAFWGTRRSLRRAERLRRRLENSCVGYTIRTYSMVAMSIQDWRLHLQLHRCISSSCPSIRQPDRPPGWGEKSPADAPAQLAAHLKFDESERSPS